MKKSLNQLGELTGVDRRTIKRRLESLKPEVSGRAHLYPVQEALELIFSSPTDGALDLNAERAALAKAQRHLAELKKAQLDGELLPAKEVQADADRAGRMVKDVFQSLPARIASMLVGLDDREIERLLRREVHECLMVASVQVAAKD